MNLEERLYKEWGEALRAERDSRLDKIKMTRRQTRKLRKEVLKGYLFKKWDLDNTSRRFRRFQELKRNL